MSNAGTPKDHIAIKEVDSSLTVSYISDVHIDHHLKDCTPRKVKSYIKNYLLPRWFDMSQKGDVICLAGDIFDKHESAFNVFSAFKSFYKEVMYVYGNHECYVYSKKLMHTEDKLNHIRQAAKDTGVHMLEGTTVNVHGVTFGGSSAWYDFSYGIQKHGHSFNSMLEYWKDYMSDATLVYDSYVLQPTYPYTKRIPSLDFKSFMLKRLDEVKRLNESVDIMLTHIGPKVPEALPLKYKEANTGFYFFDGEDDIVRIQPKVWIFGHTHQTYDEVFYKTRLLCNPYGYPSERLGNRIKAVEIPVNTFKDIKEIKEEINGNDIKS